MKVIESVKMVEIVDETSASQCLEESSKKSVDMTDMTDPQPVEEDSVQDIIKDILHKNVIDKIEETQAKRDSNGTLQNGSTLSKSTLSELSTEGEKGKELSLEGRPEEETPTETKTMGTGKATESSNDEAFTEGNEDSHLLKEIDDLLDAEKKEEEKVVTPKEATPSEVTPKEKMPNYEEAIEKLNSIANSSRHFDLEDEQKGNDEPVKNGDVSVNHKVKEVEIKRVKKFIKKLTKKELEDMLSTSLVEILSSRSELGVARARCDSLEAGVEKWQKRSLALQKQCQDLNTVMKKYITEVQQGKLGTAPIKINRSVGLQVLISGVVPEKKRVVMAPPRPAASSPAATRTILNTPVRGITNNKSPAQTTISRAVKNVAHQVTTTPSTTPSIVLPPNVSLIKSPPPGPLSSKRKLIPMGDTPPAEKVHKEEEVIDLVDDDEEETQQAAVMKRVGSGIRVVPTSQLQNPVVPPRSVTYMVNNGTITPTQVSLSGGVSPLTRAIMVSQAPTPIRSIAPKPTFATSNSIIIRNGSPINTVTPIQRTILRHPAPLPIDKEPQATDPLWKSIPPKTTLKITQLKAGIVVSWTMDHQLSLHAEIASYQIYAYQERKSSLQKPNSSLWNKVGDVKALPLPMACTLTQFQPGHKYHFAVRAQDIHGRVGPFSEPQCISLS